MKHILKFYLNLNYKRKMVLTCVLVGLIPLTLLGTFCYSQTVSMLLEKEQDSMSSSVNTAYNSMNHEIQLYEDQISYLTNLETIIHVASDSYDSTIEKFEVLNYTYDVLLSGIYSQTPGNLSDHSLCRPHGSVSRQTAPADYGPGERALV